MELFLKKKLCTPTIKKACSFERIYFSRGSDAEIYQERKNLGKLILPAVLEAIEKILTIPFSHTFQILPKLLFTEWLKQHRIS